MTIHYSSNSIWQQASVLEMDALLPGMLYHGTIITVDPYKIHICVHPSCYPTALTLVKDLLHDALTKEVISGYKYLRQEISADTKRQADYKRQEHIPIVIYPHPEIEKKPEIKQQTVELLKKNRRETKTYSR